MVLMPFSPVLSHRVSKESALCASLQNMGGFMHLIHFTMPTFLGLLIPNPTYYCIGSVIFASFSVGYCFAPKIYPSTV